jgi:REP element-mobilizing transposase RayT
MELGRIYFFTATIHNWLPLLIDDSYKEIIISSLKFLKTKELIRIYGFVIMPNHIHLIWELLEMNGKESPHSSFLKFTGHQFLKKLRNENLRLLEKFKVDLLNKDYEFWQRDSLPIEIYSTEIIFQKLEYLHNNPCKGKWMLANNPDDYRYSSFKFYETDFDRFGILTHIGERL